MVDEIVLRDSVYRDSLRFDVSPSLWRCLYSFDGEKKAPNVITVKQNGTLRGYAAYTVFQRGQLKTLSILDMVADSQDALGSLIDRVIEQGRLEGADLIYLRKSPSAEDSRFDRKGFLSFVESVIVVALFNPLEILTAISQDNVSGVNLQLDIKGFAPISLIVGKNGIKVSTIERLDVKVFTDPETFLKLFLGRTTFLEQFLRRRVKVSSFYGFMHAKRLFDLVKQRKWHIPFGDWA